MREYLLKDCVDSKNSVQRKEMKTKTARTRRIDDMSAAGAGYYWPSREVVQRQIYYYDSAMKKKIEIKTLEEFNRCIHGYGLLTGGVDINPEDFTEAERPMLNQAIELLNDDEIWAITGVQNAIALIRTKIQEVTARNQAQAVAANDTEQARIHELAARLDDRWARRSGGSKGGVFIGDPEKWHIHTEIGTQEHLKRGIGPKRVSINNYDAICTAVQYLKGSGGLTEDSGKDCYRWLRYNVIKSYERDLPPELRYDDI